MLDAKKVGTECCVLTWALSNATCLGGAICWVKEKGPLRWVRWMMDRDLLFSEGWVGDFEIVWVVSCMRLLICWLIWKHDADSMLHSFALCTAIILEETCTKNHCPLRLLGNLERVFWCGIINVDICRRFFERNRDSTCSSGVCIHKS